MTGERRTWEITTLTYDRLVDDAETKMAYLFIFGGEEVWLPKSQVEDIRETVNEVDIPLWLAVAKDIEGYEG